jgi:hypothetical protein
MSERMTDERLAEYVEAAESVPEQRRGVVERLVFALEAERQRVEESVQDVFTQAKAKHEAYETIRAWENKYEAAEAKVAELEEQRDAAERWARAMENWITRAEAAESRLADVCVGHRTIWDTSEGCPYCRLDGIAGLVEKYRELGGKLWASGVADELQAELDKAND